MDQAGARNEADRRLVARQRLEIVDAVVIALERREELMDLACTADDTDDARRELMSAFGISEVAATAVMDLQVRRFTRTQQQRIRDEREELLRLAGDLPNSR